MASDIALTYGNQSADRVESIWAGVKEEKENLYEILPKEVTMDPLGRQKIQARSFCLR